MHIARIVIDNFRSVRHAEFALDQVNVFVGQNNHGKTNIFEAVRWFFDGTKKGENLDDLRFERERGNEITVEVEFVGAQSAVERMKNASNQKKMRDALNGSDTISIRRSTKNSAEKLRTYAVGGKWVEKPATGFDNAIDDLLPAFQYVFSKLYAEEVTKLTQKSPMGTMLFKVLLTILETCPEYQQFNQQFDQLFGGEASVVKIELDQLGQRIQVHLAKQFPDCVSVSFPVAPPQFEDLLKNLGTNIDDGVGTPASEKGDGMQRAFMLAILREYADFRRTKEGLTKEFLFFIDEVELHLHPSAQRLLRTLLSEIASKGDQVFFNTHSAVMVAHEDHQQKIYCVEKTGKESDVYEVDEFKKPYLIFDLLGGSPSDLLLPKNFLIVEGKTETEFLLRVIRRFYPNQPELQLIPAHGDMEQSKRSFNAIEKAYSPLGKSLYRNRVVILHDLLNDRTEVNEFIRDNSQFRNNGQLVELPVGSIEEYYPKRDGWCRDPVAVTTDKVKLARKVGNNITQQEFETDMPAVHKALIKAWELCCD